jgi:hypothetical protein
MAGPASDTTSKDGVAMRLDLIKKTEGTWTSFNEPCGTGDGVTKDFKTPILVSEARSVLVIRSSRTFEMMDPANRLVRFNERDGTVLSDEPDGYKLETRGEDPYLWIVLDQALAFGFHVSVSCLGRKVGDSFKVLPMGSALQKRIYEKKPAIFRKRDNKAAPDDQDVAELGRVTFQELVVDWSNIYGDDSPLPCDTEGKNTFLSQKDAGFFGLFVSNRSAELRAEGMNSFATDSKNS